MTSDQFTWWSWEHVLAEIPGLGIPHFQRGEVWASGNRVALLESMYDASPCGSFVLWHPEGPLNWERIGVPLYKIHDVGPDTRWLVNGQQRTRTLLGIYLEIINAEQNASSPKLLGSAILRELESLTTANSPAQLPVEGPPPDEQDGDNEAEEEQEPHRMHPVWYALLPALASLNDAEGNSLFGAWGDVPQVRQGSLFRLLEPRVSGRKNTPGLPRGLVPLGVLLARQHGPFANPLDREEMLAAIAAQPRNNETLNRLAPWGPQYFSGFAMKDNEPMRWQDINPKLNLSSFRQLFDPAHADIFAQFRNMMDGRRFAVGELPRQGIGAAITAYVRINRAGIRVQKEEQALAILTRWDDQILDYLGEYCRRLDDNDQPATNQRVILVHSADKLMGFPVWISTVTRYTTLFMFGWWARNWMGVDAIDRKSFADCLEQWPRRMRPDFAHAGPLIKEVSTRASEALLLMDDIYSRELFIDHRMARPAVATIRPLLDLFAHLPPRDIAALKGVPAFRVAIAHLIHLTALHPSLKQEYIEALCAAIHGYTDAEDKRLFESWPKDGSQILSPETSNKLANVLKSYILALYGIWREHIGLEPDYGSVLGENEDPIAMLRQLTSWAGESFGREVDSATSIQRPAVNWLYAIERKNEAREFDWSVQLKANAANNSTGVAKVPPDGVARKLGASGEPTLYPERQHIIPFVDARTITGRSSKRGGASPSNRIGNLTWLSARQNGFEYGFSDRWAALDVTVEPDNLAARGFLATDTSGSRALDVYNNIRTAVTECRRLGHTLKNREVTHLYSQLTAIRAAWLKSQMQQWLSTPLPHESLIWLGLAPSDKAVNSSSQVSRVG